jgi:O-antigen ligase
LLTKPLQPEAEHFLDSRWYAFADLVCAAIAGALWAFSGGQLGWWPLLIAVLPWPVRILHGRFPLNRTSFDWLLLLFLITAVIGTWTAYDGDTAWAKFWLIVAAILLFYALAGQPHENIWPVLGALTVLGSVIAGFFLLTHNWLEQPARFAALQELGRSWMSVRPQLPFNKAVQQASAAEGVMAILLPIASAVTLYLVRRRKWLSAILLTLAGAVLVAGLIMSSSRSAWLALAGGLLVWSLWSISRLISHNWTPSRRQTFLLLLLLLILIAVALILLYPGGLAGIARQLPGPNRANRLALSQDTLNLIKDYALTGSGLGSFPGQYSQYSQITPVFLFGHAHNTFLDIALEQGIAGLILLLALFGMSFWLLSGLEYAIPDIGQNDLLHGSLLAGLSIIILHGLVDDPLYNSNGLPLLFAFSSISAAVTRRQPFRVDVFGYRLRASVILLSAVLILGVLSAIVFRNSLQSAWHGNSGALNMAHVELDSSWPTNRWQGDSKVPQLQGAESQFLMALEQNSSNVTALYRLGLIALAREEFDTAVGYLAAAQQIMPDHRGIRKALGYSALWNGDRLTAAAMLSTLPEAQYELGNYAGWWPQQGHPDLGVRAVELLELLQDS